MFRRILAVLTILALQGQVSCQCRQKIDVVFLVDTSLSIRKSNFVIMQNFMKGFVDYAKDSIESGLMKLAAVRFASESVEEISFDDPQNVDSLKTMIGNIRKTGRKTYTGAGMQLIRTETFKNPGARSDASKLLIIMTDGSPTDSPVIPTEVELYNTEKINRIALGMTMNIDIKELEALASSPRNVIHVKEFSDLNDESLLSKLLDLTCSVPPFRPVISIGKCKKDAAIIIVTDRSLSTVFHWPKIMDFVANLIESIEKHRKSTKQAWGIENFSDITDTKLLIKLNHTETNEQVMNVIRSKERGILTETAIAMKMAREHGFSPDNGYKDGAKKIVVLVTDGYSSDPIKLAQEMAEQDKADIMRLAIGLHGVRKEMEIVAGKDGAYFKIDAMNDVDKKIEEILKKFYCP